MAKAKSKQIKKEDESKQASVYQMKIELQKLALDVKSGKEKNTSKINKQKKAIARLLTKK